MSKGLEALGKVRKAKYMFAVDNQQACDIIEQELKALEIINKKDVHITLIKNCENADQYNRGLLATMNKTTAKKYVLNVEQFTTVKETLNGLL